jgi:hypothetical protein
MRERSRAILDVRARRPQAIAQAAARPKRRPALLGLVVGRALLFPPDDVAGAVAAAAGLVQG